MVTDQLTLFPGSSRLTVTDQLARFPGTRYQGSKRKLLPWILSCVKPIPFETALDAFSGSGAVAYGLKAMGKQVIANDQLHSNRLVAEALVVNDGQRLDPDEATALLERVPGRQYGTFVADTFADIYYTHEENQLLDILAGNIAAMVPGPRRALAYFALFQACLVKRPFNLFHRRNLSVRMAPVKRTFGNKTTWERPFAELLARFAQEGSAAVFEGKHTASASAHDVLQLTGSPDLVYLDPPYVPGRGPGTDYLRYYHFLEGLCDLDSWPRRIDETSRNLHMNEPPSPWADRRQIRQQLRRVYDRFPGAVLALSYRSDGVPAADELQADLRAVRGQVQVHDAGEYRYALSTNRRSREYLFIAY